jgi:hypothetical protein
VTLNPLELVDPDTRSRLAELPASVRVKGDVVALEYDIEDGTAVARLRLREGQARRLQLRDLPVLDRPLRFEVIRGRHPPVRGASLPDLQRELNRLARRDPRFRGKTKRGRFGH